MTSPSCDPLRLALLASDGAAPSRDAIDLSRYAFFFDLDGTLAPIVPVPDAARVPPATIATLAGLQLAVADAMAVISGRAADTLDHLLRPLHLCLAGMHGAQWRGPGGRLEQARIDPVQARALVAALSAIARRHPGTQLENKGMSFALHYRNAPQAEGAVHAEAMAIAPAFGRQFDLQYGKMVIEFKPRGVDKGQALQRFMQVSPFRGRVPVMAGDDLTDETAFAAANAMRGISIKIGDGPTCATGRLDTPETLANRLARLLPRS